MATLSYVGDDIGWDRKHMLVDEQDATGRWMAWEPGYANEVTVEVVLDAPVPVTDIRLAQDPFREMDGVITLGVNGNSYALQLGGIGGWQVQTFGAGTSVDRFTLSRASVASDIMEVLVCVEP